MVLRLKELMSGNLWLTSALEPLITMVRRTPARSSVAELDDGSDPGLDTNEQPLLPGTGKPWGKLIAQNEDPGTKQKHPFSCAIVGCTHKYTKSSCNATKVGWHICGKTGAKTCAFATEEDKMLFPSMRKAATVESSGPTGSTTMPMLVHCLPSAVDHPQSTTSIDTLSLEEIVALQEAETERELVLSSNQHSLPGLLRHVANKTEMAKLNTIWAKAVHHAGLPPNVMENDYIRDAIFQTSKSMVGAMHMLCCASSTIAADRAWLAAAACAAGSLGCRPPFPPRASRVESSRVESSRVESTLAYSSLVYQELSASYFLAAVRC